MDQTWILYCTVEDAHISNDVKRNKPRRRTRAPFTNPYGFSICGCFLHAGCFCVSPQPKLGFACSPPPGQGLRGGEYGTRSWQCMQATSPCRFLQATVPARPCLSAHCVSGPCLSGSCPCGACQSGTLSLLVLSVRTFSVGGFLKNS